jgi:SulP family sulfate permease
MAFGVTSGAGAIAGLWGAIVLGLIAAPLGGTPSQVSGPTGPMTVIMAGIIATMVQTYGTGTGLALAFTVALVAGLFQVIFGVLRLGQFIVQMPYSVISGFMSGIGGIVLVLQLPVMLGLSLRGSVPEILGGVWQELGSVNGIALSIGLITFALVRLYPKRFNSVLPGPLVALVLVTAISTLVTPDALPRLGEIPQGLPELRWPQLGIGDVRVLGGYALTLAVLGSIDSLLTSLVADNITRTQHDSDRELIGQGLGNMAAALLGGLPGAGATMRTVTNVQAGGRTPLSGIVHSLVLLVVTLGAGGLASVIPLAVLGGILVNVGIEIVDWNFLRRAPRLSVMATALMWLVLLLTIFWDLVTAVVVGVFIANVLTIKGQAEALERKTRRFEGGRHYEDLDGQEQALLQQLGSDVVLLSLQGPLSFGASRYLTQLLTVSAVYRTMLLDLGAVTNLDVTAALAIDSLCRDAAKQGRQVLIAITDHEQRQRIERLQLDRNSAVRCVNSRREALNLLCSEAAQQ